MLPPFGQYVIIKSMDKNEEKQLEYLFAHMNRLWVGSIALGGGISGLAISLELNFALTNILKIILLVIGFLFFAFMIIGLRNMKLEIDKKIKGDL